MFLLNFVKHKTDLIFINILMKVRALLNSASRCHVIYGGIH